VALDEDVFGAQPTRSSTVTSKGVSA
jgi:hypothetical protein